MITRRNLLAGTSIGLLSAFMPTAPSLARSPQDAAIRVIADKIRTSISRTAEESQIPLSVLFPDRGKWCAVPNLEDAVRDEIASAFKHPLFAQHKERFGSIADADGELRILPQMALRNRFFIVPKLQDGALFDAFNTLAPSHLL